MRPADACARGSSPWALPPGVGPAHRCGLLGSTPGSALPTSIGDATSLTRTKCCQHSFVISPSNAICRAAQNVLGTREGVSFCANKRTTRTQLSRKRCSLLGGRRETNFHDRPHASIRPSARGAPQQSRRYKYGCTLPPASNQAIGTRSTAAGYGDIKNVLPGGQWLGSRWRFRSPATPSAERLFGCASAWR